MTKREIAINVREDGRIAVGVYWENGKRISGTVFQQWPAVLELIVRASLGYETRIMVRSERAVNTPEGLIY